MRRWKIQYQGTAPGMGVVVRHFDSQEAARLWARQVGVDGRADIVNCEAEERLHAAAPDLLAALEFAYQELETAHRFKVGIVNPEALGDARDAIAKARGEE